MEDKVTKKSIQEKESETLKYWEDNHIFKKTIVTPAGSVPKGKFKFYDGPPFATGLPHHGHILAGTIKDAIPRYQTMRGNSVRRVWGWDTHGLPIENLVEKELNLSSKKDIESYGIDKFNKRAAESVLKYEKEWKQIIPKLGRFVDMNNAYATMDYTYTESIWWAWKELHSKGLVYEGYKMMHICPRCETPLAQSEVGMNYEDVTDLSLTAKFELVDEPGTYVLAWTTTPWTLPGNVALALKKDADYVKVSIEGMEGLYILAKERFSDYLKDFKYEIKEEYKGVKLVGKTYKPLFNYYVDKEIENKENIWKIWHADFITLDQGTGIAHEAPAFGEDDMNLAKANNIPIIKHVKMDGTFTEDVTDFAGKKVKEVGDSMSADIEIVKHLAGVGLLFEKHKIVHSYPLCWRCKTPLLNYATSSWFVDVPKLKPRLLEENSKIGWTPEHVRDGRFGKWLEGAREWAVSRARYWGAPLPIWKNSDGSEIKIIGSLTELAMASQPKNNYFVMRHGESKSNVSQIIESSGDASNGLTDNGVNQVMKGVDEIKAMNIDVILSSPFPRAMETASLVGKTIGIKVDSDERLKEFNLGNFNGKSIKEYTDNFGIDYLALDTRVEGGETHREMMNRTMTVISDCENKMEGKNILFVTHGGPARMMIMGSELITQEEVLDDERTGDRKMYLNNAAVRKLDLKIVPRDESGSINLHRPYIDQVTFKDSNGGEMKRIGDVFDCWFESGSMPFASIHYPFENKKLIDDGEFFPADFIAEGLDQTRGWFYSLINLGVGLFDKAPYKHVIVNGLVLAESGEKLSKSEKNFTDPMELVEKFGADSIRYYLLASPVVKGESIQFNDKGVEEVYKKLIGRLENVVTLYEMYKVDLPNVPPQTNVLDKWIINRLNEVIKASTEGYDSFKLDIATLPIEKFIDDLSVWYVRRSRERLKGDLGEKEMKESQATLKYVLNELSKVLAPSMPFLAERIYLATGGEKESVHLESWPTGGEVSKSILEEMIIVREIVSKALMLRSKEAVTVRQPLRSLSFKEKIDPIYYEIIKQEVNVKEIISGGSGEVTLDFTRDEGLLKEGEIRELMRSIQDARKEKGLTPSDFIDLDVSFTEEYFERELVENLKKICKINNISFNQDIISSGIPVDGNLAPISFKFK